MTGAAPSGRRVLYLSYDGMTDPLGRSQVLPYLVGLAGLGHQITLISFEKPERRAAGEGTVRQICSAAGIDWRPLPYHKSPPILSTVRDIAAMRRLAEQLQRLQPFDIVHCRSYLSALVGLRLKRRFGVSFLFDMRGFWIDERLEMGLWRASHPAYAAVTRFFRGREGRFVAESDGIVSLTRNARDEMKSWPLAGDDLDDRTSVIPCCVDFAHFDPRSGAARSEGRALLALGADVPVLVYLGSLGGTYMLDEMLAFFRAFRTRHPGAIFLFVTQHDPHEIRRSAADAGISPAELIIRPATREEVPALVAAGDLSVAFKRPSYSAKACSPTKLGETLALGVPVVANSGVGDTDEILSFAKAGAVVDRFDEASLGEAIDRVERAPVDPEQIRESARHWFALEDGIASYDRIYRKLGRR